MSWTIEDTCRHSVLCWLATVDARGRPSVSPKEMWRLAGDEFQIADIASAGSVRAIRANPEVCVSLIDIFRQRGHKLFGAAEIIGCEDEGFDALHGPLADMAGPHFPIWHVIRIKIERSAEILAPSYRIFPDRTEAEHIGATKARYGV